MISGVNARTSAPLSAGSWTCPRGCWLLLKSIPGDACGFDRLSQRADATSSRARRYVQLSGPWSATCSTQASPRASIKPRSHDDSLLRPRQCVETSLFAKSFFANRFAEKQCTSFRFRSRALLRQSHDLLSRLHFLGAFKHI